MKRIFKIKKLKIATVLVLVLTLCAGVFLSPASTSVNAVSLPYIEVKKDEGSFDILEIVPQAGSGSIGYYVRGYEPCADWVQQLKSKTSKEERENYINTLFGLLESRGILGNLPDVNALTPKYKNGSDFYNEYYSWSNDRPSNLTEVKLDKPETVSVHASFSPVDGGSFRSNHRAEINLSGGTHIQNIDSFVLGDMGQDAFYYTPEFAQIIDEEMKLSYMDKAMYTVDYDNSILVYTEYGIIGTDAMPEGVPCFLKTEEDVYVRLTAEEYPLDENQEKTIYIADGESSTFRYKYYGIVGITSMEFSTAYYVVTSTGQPSGNYSSETALYAAVPNSDNPFIQTDGSEGHFDLTLIGYTYVGAGNGNSEITLGAGEYTYDITYDTVFCECGFTNNELLKKYVFDFDTNEDGNFVIRVNSVVASELTANDITKADMVVLSKGYNPASPTSSVSGYSAANDITAENKASLLSMAQWGYPFIADSALTGVSALNLAALSSECINGAAGFSVKNSVFCFKSGESINGSVVTDAIATGAFLTAFSDSVVENRFKPVLDEINTENFYREIDGTEPLSADVSIAKVIRHIINYRGKRADTVKDKITVLEIQPLAVNTTLQPSTVLSWLGGGTEIGLKASDITVVSMTTGEFIGKLEDINEKYDLIYIGASTDSFNTKLNGTTDYNDDTMEGLIYTNIGDLYRSDIRMAGLLARDYLTVNTGWNGSVTGINKTSGNQSNLFRFSGNDITESKSNELQDFINAGYPVVVANTLMNGNNVNAERVDSSSNMYTLLDSVKSKGNFVTVSETSGYYSGNVLKYLQVSKPEIELEKYPTKYENNSGTATAIAGYTLEYKFKIKNITDATPTSTTYNVHLYIDLNADGRYSETEALDDIEIYDAAGVQLTPEATTYTDKNGEYEVFTYSLYAGELYTVKRQMPADYVGIIPWKLEIIKNGADHIHASETGYTRIAAKNKQLVKILQIAMAGKSGDYINLESQLTVNPYGNNTQLRGNDRKYYSGIYGKLIADLDDFDVICKTVEADDLERMSDVSGYLSGYDMLIIGFGDMYDGIGQKTAQAITEFIASQKSVLFTHDTTSQANVEDKDYRVIVEDDGDERETYTLNSNVSKSNSYYISVKYNKKYNRYVDTTVEFDRSYDNKLLYVYYDDDRDGRNDDIWLDGGTYTLTCSIDNTGGMSMYVGVDWNNSIDVNSDPSVRVESETNAEKITVNFTVPNGGKWVRVFFIQASAGNVGSFTIKDFTISKESLVTEPIGFDGNLEHWGYYFNTVIRDSVGLDRYGITSKLPTGLGTLQSMLYMQNDGTNLTPEQIKAIIDNERTVAYAPDTGKTQTVAETQGYTNYALIRYGENGYLRYADNDYSVRETNKVSQVNKGQITTYPYDINTADFGGTAGAGNIMGVGATHEQYYQLNMNTDDIVVWYCLTGGGTSNSYYSDSPNDVVNAYYIYNKGNVTYSGVGHTAGNDNYTGYNIGSQYINEAKLFVNTMIAAYRSGVQKPSVSIKSSSSGNGEMSIKYFVTENKSEQILDSEAMQTVTGNENRAVYYKITDTNLGISKTITVNYYIPDAEGEIVAGISEDEKVTEMTGLKTYLAATNIEETFIKGGRLYKIYLPDNVIESLSKEDTTSIRIYIRVCTDISGQKLYGTDSIELRKIGLFDLK